MVNKNVYLVTRIDFWNESPAYWIFKDKEIAEKFIEVQYKKGGNFDYDLHECEYEDDYLQFNSDKTDLIGKCLSVTKEDDLFKTQIEEKTLSDLLDEFDNCSYSFEKENTIKERIPHWLKQDDCVELEEKLKKYFYKEI